MPIVKIYFKGLFSETRYNVVDLERSLWSPAIRNVHTTPESAGVIAEIFLRMITEEVTKTVSLSGYQ